MAERFFRAMKEQIVSRQPGAGCDILVDGCGRLTGALGIAVLARASGIEERFDFAVRSIPFKTTGLEWSGCPNDCEIVCVLCDDEFKAGWGNRCEAGLERMRSADDTSR